MKTITIFGLFILLGLGASGQIPPTHATTPHEQAHQQAIQHHQQMHEQAVEDHRKAHETALEAQEDARKKAKRNLVSRSRTGDKSNFLTRWRERRMEKAAARKQEQENKQEEEK